MSVVDHNAIDALPRISEAEVGDYLALLKPRVMSLVVFTALVGLVIAPGHVHPVLAFTAILCIAVEPRDPTIAGSLEFENQAAIIRSELTRIGFHFSPDLAHSELVAAIECALADPEEHAKIMVTP